MRIKVSKQSENTFNVSEDKQSPKLATHVTAIPGEKGKYRISIIHPNGKIVDYKMSYDKLYDEVHEADSFDAALEIARKIEKTMFFDVVTVHEDIKHIPNYKKGFVKLKTKEAVAEETKASNDLVKKQKKEAKEAQKDIKKIMAKDNKIKKNSKINNKINKKQKKPKK